MLNYVGATLIIWMLVVVTCLMDVLASVTKVLYVAIAMEILVRNLIMGCNIAMIATL